MTQLTRRHFLATSAAAAAVPLFVPSYVLRPSRANVLRIGAIGTGRMGFDDLRNVATQGLLAGVDAHVIAVCDLDESRALHAKRWLHEHYRKALPGAVPDVAVYRDYRELLARDDIDAVTISTPEHWHTLIGIHAAQRKKGIYVQKPMTYSHREGQLLIAAVRSNQVVLQVGSQQRSDAKFLHACELVRNGRIGKLQRIHVYLPPDSGVGDAKTSPVPEGFDFDTWMGPTEVVPYAMGGVHPQSAPDGRVDFSRPGWLQIRRYCLGMITGWGSHMNDIAQWGHGGDDCDGPCEYKATAELSPRGLFNVHTTMRAECRYADGVELVQETGDPAGVRFHGTDGEVWVQRGKITSNPASLLQEQFGAGDTRLYQSANHYRNWLECVRSGKEPICPVEVGHRSTSLCINTELAMRLGRTLHWDPKQERFRDDDEANRMLDYAHRAPWSL